MMMTSMPKRFSSHLKQSDQPSSACLLAWYQDPSGVWILPATEETLTIFPAPLCRMWGEDELGQPRNPEEVYLELVAGVVQRRFLHRAEQSEAGVVDENVDAASLRVDSFDAGNEVFFAGDVHLEGNGSQGFEVSHLLDSACGGIDGVALVEEPYGGVLAYA